MTYIKTEHIRGPFSQKIDITMNRFPHRACYAGIRVAEQTEKRRQSGERSGHCAQTASRNARKLPTFFVGKLVYKSV
jgi:hypothetical protein